MSDIKKVETQGGGKAENGLKCLSPSEALALLKGNAVLLDIREEYETNFRQFDVPETILFSQEDLPDKLECLPRDRLLVVADNVGMYSKEVALQLLALGFSQVASLTGGMVDWYREGFPVAVDRGFELTGSCSCKLRPRKQS